MKSLASGVLTLIVLQVFSSGPGPAAGGKLATWIAGGLKKALSPEVAAIPTVKTRKAPPSSSTGPAPGGTTLPRNPAVGQQKTA